MPLRPLRPCKNVGCAQLTKEVNGYCEEHKHIYNDRTSRPIYHAWYSTERWRKARSVFLHNNPVCVKCMKRGKVTPATVVDHIDPHAGDTIKFWNVDNWQALCKKCHDRKTATKDGGFGNRKISASCDDRNAK